MAGGDPVHWLAGRVAVVTGASRGIGAATAEAIAAAGAHVVLAARDREALDRVAGHIRRSGGEATPVPTDVSNGTDVERLFAAFDGAGPVAALVCAAGVLTSAPFAETTTGIWEQTLRVNLTGSFLCCRAAFTAMLAAGEGRIVVDTEMLRRANPALRPGLTPADVAGLIVALLDSPLAPASGANIPLFSNA